MVGGWQDRLAMSRREEATIDAQLDPTQQAVLSNPAPHASPTTAALLLFVNGQGKKGGVLGGAEKLKATKREFKA